MEKTDLKAALETVERLIAENRTIAEADRTPQLDVALGGLLTARENLQGHLARVERE